VHLVGSYHANISRCTVHTILNLNYRFSYQIEQDLCDLARVREVSGSHSGAAEHAMSSGVSCCVIRRVVSTPQIHGQVWQYSYYI
jgi:hypothetical protein